MAAWHASSLASSLTHLLLAQAAKEPGARASRKPRRHAGLCGNSAATSHPAVQDLGHLALWQAQLSSRDTPGVLGLASCGLASASLPGGSHFPSSPLDLLELEAFHGLSLPQAPDIWKGRRHVPPLASCGRVRAQRRAPRGWLGSGGFAGLMREINSLALFPGPRA